MEQNSQSFAFPVPEARNLELVVVKLDDGRVVVRTAEELRAANPRPTTGGGSK